MFQMAHILLKEDGGGYLEEKKWELGRFIQEITKFLMAQFIWIQINQDSEHAIHGSQHVSCSDRAKVPLPYSIILTVLLASQ